jgi:hypothetical protein
MMLGGSVARLIHVKMRAMTPARWMRFGWIGAPGLLAASRGLAAVQSSRAAPIALWGRSAQHCEFALVAPRKFAPGRASRWRAWALAPAIGACRRLGVAAYLEGGEIWLHGRRIAQAEALALGECVVATSAIPAHIAPAAAVEEALRSCLEAQCGWQFDHSWPNREEAAAIACARDEALEPLLRQA